MSLLRQVLAWTHDATGNAIGSAGGALNVALYDGLGNPIESYRGAINTHDADVHREIVDRYFHQHTTPATTLSVASLAGATSITVTSSVGFVVGDFLHINTTAEELVHPRITAIVGNVLTLNKPLDYAHAIGSTVEKAILNMNAVGSLASPVSFKVFPEVGKVWHLLRITMSLAHGTAGDFGLFGGITALTNGVVFRKYDGATGQFVTFTVWRDNDDINADMGDLHFVTRSGGGGTYGTAATGNFKDLGAIAYLNGTAGDYLELLIQDDLSTLNSFRVKAQGHFEGA